MSNLHNHHLVRQSYEVSQAIEECGASAKLTAGWCPNGLGCQRQKCATICNSPRIRILPGVSRQVFKWGLIGAIVICAIVPWTCIEASSQLVAKARYTTGNRAEAQYKTTVKCGLTLLVLAILFFISCFLALRFLLRSANDNGIGFAWDMAGVLVYFFIAQFLVYLFLSQLFY